MSTQRHRLFFATLFLALACRAAAHPGTGIVVDSRTNIYVVAGDRIVQVSPSGEPRVLLSDPSHARFYQLHHLFLDAEQRLYTAGDMAGAIWKVGARGSLEPFYPPANQDRPVRVGLGGDPFAIDRRGGVVTVNAQQDRYSQLIVMAPDGAITRIIGGRAGHSDGAGDAARFGDLHGSAFVFGPDGTLYLSDAGRYLRKVSDAGVVATIAGGAERGFADGTGGKARFNGVSGVAVDSAGTVFAADTENHRIRRITPNGETTTLAGSGKAGSADGLAASASFQNPTGVALGPDGAVYVLEPERMRVRRIGVDGRVTTIGRWESLK